VTPVPFVATEIRDGIATVRLQRPEALNAISGEMATAVAGEFRRVAADRDVRVAVLAAAGERAFCVGADLKERGRLDREGWLDNRERIRDMFASLRDTAVPTIASVFGYALGGGFELALSCDLLVAADDVVFGLPEATVGIVPGGGGTQLLARRCGLARAKELIFTGRRLPVEQALEWGIANRVVARNELADATADLAAQILRASPVAVREAKSAIDAGFGSALREGIETEDAAWHRAIDSADRAEGVAAWGEKREPRWTNR
jgi:enoyl-CoA hydratase/carnithine racemase